MDITDVMQLNANQIPFRKTNGPRGEVVELTHANVTVNILASMVLGKALLEIYSDNRITPDLFWEVRTLLHYINYRRHSCDFLLLHDGRYCLRAVVSFEQKSDGKEVHKLVGKMRDRFVRFSPYIDDVAIGTKGMSDAVDDLAVGGLISGQ
jgi:hypothetical protein